MATLIIEKSNGRTKTGELIYFVRPAGKCHNRSWRVKANKVSEFCRKKFSNVSYFRVNGLVIGASSEENAVKEYYRICEKSKIGKPVDVKTINYVKN